MESFLDKIEPIKSKIGMIMFQFEYLNKQKMNSQLEFQQRLEEFFLHLNREYDYAIEIRNPNYLNKNWFTFLLNHDISNVFLHGYYMPNIYDTYLRFEEFIKSKTVLRLHGFDRKGIEERTNKIWNDIVEPMDEDIHKIVEIIKLLKNRNVDIYLNVNNHFEGSAPLTINKIKKQLNYD